MNSLQPTTDKVLCFYNGSFKDPSSRVECAYDNSRWVFVAADQVTKDGDVLCKDDLFYIAEYLTAAKSKYLAWNNQIGNFDLVQKSQATVFQFPSSPVDQGSNHSTCQYVPGYVGQIAPAVPLWTAETRVSRSQAISIAMTVPPVSNHRHPVVALPSLGESGLRSPP